MKDRIKELRKALKLTQQEFGKRIGVKQNTVAQYEIGRNPPTDTVINYICDKFSVNESWLRTGEGEMFVPRTRKEEIAALFGRVISGKDETMEKFINVLAQASEDQLLAIAELAESFAKEFSTKEKK